MEDRCQPPSLAANCNFLRHPALLALQKVEAETTNRTGLLTTLMDKGSQITLLREGAAVDLGLGPGTPWTMFLQVVGSQNREIPTTLHTFSLKDATGNLRLITAATVTSIASCGNQPDLGQLRQLFPGAVEGAFS